MYQILFSSDIDDSSHSNIFLDKSYQNDILNESQNYFGDSSIEERINEHSGRFGINSPSNKNINILYNLNNEQQSTGFNSKINNFSEIINQNKIVKKNPIKEGENQNLIGKKTKRDNKDEKEFGRKKKGSAQVKFHTKYNDDNIITKIKIFILNSARDLLNSSFIYFNQKLFLKIAKIKYQSIKKDIILKLLSTKLKNIFSDNISLKYSTINNKNYNMDLINKIYEENVETNVIQILELTFGDLLNIFRGTISNELQEKIRFINNIKENFKCLPYFLEKIIADEKANDEIEDNINVYVNKIKKLSMNYEEWFNKKRTRKTKNDNMM